VNSKCQKPISEYFSIRTSLDLYSLRISTFCVDWTTRTMTKTMRALCGRSSSTMSCECSNPKKSIRSTERSSKPISLSLKVSSPLLYCPYLLAALIRWSLRVERLEKNTADLAVLQEYRRRNEEFRKRAEEFEAVSREWDSAKNQVTELRNQRLVQFMKGFGIISNKLKEMYQVRLDRDPLLLCYLR